MKIIKSRSGEEVTFTRKSIVDAISQANQRAPISVRFTPGEIDALSKEIEAKCKAETHIINTNDLRVIVQHAIMAAGKYDVATAYIEYRSAKYQQEKKNTTDESIMTLVEGENEEVKQENANKNPTVLSVQRDYIAGTISKDMTKRYLLPTHIEEAHRIGLIHFHDTDYFLQRMHNCDLWNLEDMLQNGTVINGKRIYTPHRFSTASTITSQISAVVASNQYGGQTFTLSHLAPFVEITRKTLLAWHQEHTPKQLAKMTDEEITEFIEAETRKDIKDGIQTLNYQLNTISSTNGQTPFVSVCMYLGEVDDPHTKDDLAIIIEEVLRQRIEGMENERGEKTTCAFPKLLYILEEDNIHEDSKYYYLTKLAAQCTMKRMVPDYISEKVMKQWKKDKYGNGYCFPTMGCRSILSVWNDPKTKKAKFYGRFNKGVVTINLPFVALLAKSKAKGGVIDMDTFWYILGEKLELCHQALRLRHDRLVGVKSDVAPILWQHGALARLKPGETIDKLLVGGYSTLSLGYVGLWEAVKVLTGEDTWTENGNKVATKIMKTLKEMCERWDSCEHIGYSIYGTPEESTTYKFAVALQRQFGIIPGITDKNYVTNSYHVPVWVGLDDGMDAFRKIDIETKFQQFSTGGAISYIEAPVTQNDEAILNVIKYIYDNIVYCEINNMGSCHCGNCGTDGNVTLIPDEHGKLHWHCTNCGCEDLNKLTCVVRVCGYLSSGNDVNQGRLADIMNRKTHI